ncbi:D-ala-D-ala transporter subunit [Kouleothrix aurantiaca]|uniref:D-ala-D-ala transporter subunit n=1 Tax=Kouleothrix aurantiaca TaxID=186479 RepID=A0A0P9DH24_9CHLR|nr:D-ala-D-ala transporter subunit [Kouleothrix aurantiaca]
MTRAWRFLRANPVALVGLALVIAWVLISLLAPLIAPYGPLEQKIVQRLKPPSAAHPFGTDQLGRDVLTRVLYGGRLSLPAGLSVVLLAGIVGTAIGAISGFAGGWLDELMMRITEVFMAFPTIILAMAIASALGPSLINAILAMVVVWWPSYARVVRGLVLSVKANDYVQAARALGVPEGRILWRTVLPNCLAPAVVVATIDLGNAVLVFAGLSFLGLGPDPATPEWGRMIADGIEFFDQWWMSAFPGLAIFLVVMAFNFVGDSIRDALDPQLRNSVQ